MPYARNSFAQDEHFVYATSDGIYRLPLDELPSAQNEPKTLPFQVFPNPSSGIFHLQAGLPATTRLLRFEVMDAQGKILLSRPMPGENQAIDLSAFPAGIFTLRLVSEGGAGVQRLVKTGN